MKIFNRTMWWAPVLILALLGTAGCKKLASKEETSAAVTAARARISAQPNTPDAWVALGQAYAQDSLHNDAYIAFKKAWSMNPKNAEALRGLAECSLSLGDPSAGMTWVKQALALDSRDAAAVGLRGRLKFSQGDVAGAMADMTYARKLGPLSLKDSLTLTNLYLAQKNPSQAVAQAEDTVRRFPTEGQAHHNYAVLLDNQKRWNDAEDEYRLAFKCDPKGNLKDKLYLAELLVRQKQKLDEARTLALEVATKEPLEGVPAAVASRALYLKGDRQTGYKELLGVQRQFTSTPMILYWIYEESKELGDKPVEQAVTQALGQMISASRAAQNKK